MGLNHLGGTKFSSCNPNRALVLPVHSTRSITLILFLKRKKNANIVGASGNTLPLTVHSHLRENYFVLEAGLRKIPPILAPYTRERIEPLAI